MTRADPPFEPALCTDRQRVAAMVAIGEPVLHLVKLGDEQDTPCHRCGRRLREMDREDDFTLAPWRASCAPPAELPQGY